MKKVLITPFIFLLLLGYKSDKIPDYIKEYQLHLDDLSHLATDGYKNNFDNIDVQGALRSTDQHLDCAILGKGFFCFSEPDTGRLLYSRNGMLVINEKGFIVNRDGYYLEPKIQLVLDQSFGRIVINTKGEIKLTRSEPEIAGRIHVYNRTGKEYQRIGNYFIFPSVEEAKDYKIISGALEMSNYSLRRKLFAMQEILYQLRDLDPERGGSYDYRIKLIDKLLYSYGELRRNMILANDDEWVMQAFYNEVEETAEFLTLQAPDGNE